MKSIVIVEGRIGEFEAKEKKFIQNLHPPEVPQSQITPKI
jgi:hypothetical protein